MEDTIYRVGYQFVPTDKELLTHYLSAKIKNQPLPYNGITECDLYGEKSPWEIFDEKKKHYVFTKLKKVGKKRVARSAGVGTWHGNNSGDEICDVKTKNVLGVKKTFTFKVKPNKNESKTAGNWIMHEFSLAGEKCSDYVVCSVEKKIKKSDKQEDVEEEEVEDDEEEQVEDDLAAYIESFIDEGEALDACAATPINESQAPAVASYDDDEEEQVEDDLAAYIESLIDESEALNTCAATPISESQASSTTAVATYDDYVLLANQSDEGLYIPDMTASSSIDVGEYGMGNWSECLLNYNDLDSVYEYLLHEDELPNMQVDEVSVQELTGFGDYLIDIPHQHVQESDVFLPTPMCA